MSDIRKIERAVTERLDEVGAQLADLEGERDRLRRALRALRDEAVSGIGCLLRGQVALTHAAPWQSDRLRR